MQGSLPWECFHQGMLTAWSNREAFPAWREHGHGPALAEPRNGDSVVGAGISSVQAWGSPAVTAPQPHCPGFSSFPPSLLTHHCSNAPESRGLNQESRAGSSTRPSLLSASDHAPSPGAASTLPAVLPPSASAKLAGNFLHPISLF